MSGRIKLVLGGLAIAAILAGLWAVYRPLLPSQAVVEPRPTPSPPRLHDAHAVVDVRLAGSARLRRSVIACDGAHRTATGYWKRDPRGACNALAATRAALVGAQGCRASRAWTVVLHAAGRFGARRFDHRAQRGACADDQGWLAVDVLAAPVLAPNQALEPASSG
jgi:hypothetical protein